jgi:hypothetical protein
MAFISRLILLLGLLGTFWESLAQPQFLTLAAAPPSPIIIVSAQSQNPFGASNPCYWVVARYPVGNSTPSAPGCASNAGSTVNVSWTPITGVSYDVLRTSTPILPSGAANIAVALAVSGTPMITDDLSVPPTSYTLNSASPATATFLLDNQNQPMPQVRLTIMNAVSTNSFLLAAAGGGGGGNVTGPAMSQVGFVPTFANTSGTALNPGLAVTSQTKLGNALVQLQANGAIFAGLMGPVITSVISATRTVAFQNEIVVCNAACAITPLAPGVGAGYQLCVQNNAGVSTPITLSALATVQYERTDRTAFKPVNSSLVSSGAVGDQICIVSSSTTQYNVFSFTGTWI